MRFCEGGKWTQLPQQKHLKAYDEPGWCVSPVIWQSVITFLLMLGCPLIAVASPHQTSTLEIPLQGDTIPQTMTFPLYEQQGIRYFSAGIGKEERSLSYPPYALKLIFVQGDRAFLTGVSLEIHKEDGNTTISIPAEEVQGPWVFIDAPKGNYLIKATSSTGKTVERMAKITEKSTSVIHFRWK
ncbi:MAG: hypothetical protein AB7P17_10775 [Nitrospirales bacterium]|nr:hypothetical protein [Nitrospirales bacterium]